jgi:hypothetical protein
MTEAAADHVPGTAADTGRGIQAFGARLRSGGRVPWRSIMTVRTFAFAAASLLALVAPSPAHADDGTRPQPQTEPTGAGSTRVTVLGEGANAMRFNVLRDRARGRLTVRLLDRRARLGLPPVVVLRTAQGVRELPLTAIEGETDAWFLADDLAKAEAFDGTLRVMVEGKPVTGPIVVATPENTVVPPPHGGRWVAFDECGFVMEVAQDFESGTLVFYGPSGVRIDRPPAVTITEGGGVTMSEAAVVEGKQVTWKFSSSAFKKRDTIARVRVLVEGRACEASLSIPPHGGRIVIVAGGPQIEVVRADTGALRFFVLEDRIGEKPFVVESPAVFVTTAEGDRSLPLTAIQGEARGWEIVHFDSPVANGKVRLRFTNGGKIVDTDLAPVFVVGR